MCKKFGEVAISLIAISLFMGSTVVRAEVDEAEVKALLKRNDCTKCHAVDKAKKGPSYKKIAAKLACKPQSEAEKIVMDNLTKGPKVKMADGTEEQHKVIDTKDPTALKNLFNWIMSFSAPAAK